MVLPLPETRLSRTEIAVLKAKLDIKKRLSGVREGLRKDRVRADSDTSDAKQQDDEDFAEIHRRELEAKKIAGDKRREEALEGRRREKFSGGKDTVSSDTS